MTTLSRPTTSSEFNIRWAMSGAGAVFLLFAPFLLFVNLVSPLNHTTPTPQAPPKIWPAPQKAMPAFAVASAALGDRLYKEGGIQKIEEFVRSLDDKTESDLMITAVIFIEAGKAQNFREAYNMGIYTQYSQSFPMPVDGDSFGPAPEVAPPADGWPAPAIPMPDIAPQAQAKAKVTVQASSSKVNVLTNSKLCVYQIHQNASMFDFNKLVKLVE